MTDITVRPYGYTAEKDVSDFLKTEENIKKDFEHLAQEIDDAFSNYLISAMRFDKHEKEYSSQVFNVAYKLRVIPTIMINFSYTTTDYYTIGLRQTFEGDCYDYDSRSNSEILETLEDAIFKAVDEVAENWKLCHSKDADGVKFVSDPTDKTNLSSREEFDRICQDFIDQVNEKLKLI